ncbi:MAG: hypothetical protein KJ057_06575 [Phycisphaerae bacterium]|nr:MAG: hypothetical protein EDS66_03735 [Planctomycetota bacterium]KAB2941730.1 MAG: hypothetical protein F9K17_12845 [Phycisphaerae bacterium]MBE7456711.1 hypothetical protein [Planctomycetia bacterium]MCK6463912.1 hypothetical protein [Phycisphaerae bacterium]MCL4718125.1 hypothetical protein [Phycisphaerae bacterium]
MNESNPFSGADAWMKFWTDAMSKMPGAPGAPASAPPPAPALSPSEMLSKMQQTFLEAWTKGMDQYMRSEAFLQMMKKSMENALAMRQQLDEFLRKTLHGAQAPSRADTSDLMQFLHTFEDRVLDQLAALSKRVDDLEGGAGGGGRTGGKTKQGGGR